MNLVSAVKTWNIRNFLHKSVDLTEVAERCTFDDCRFLSVLSILAVMPAQSPSWSSLSSLELLSSSLMTTSAGIEESLS